MSASGAGLEAFAATSTTLPSGDEWLSPREAAVLASQRIRKRRDDWRLGRWVAKQAVRASLSRRGGAIPALHEIEILAAPDGAPEVHLEDLLAPVTISLSHSAGVGFGVAAEGHLALGCDVERIEPRSDAFVADYFTPEEADYVHACPEPERAFAATLLWSAKESALKAVRQGLRRDTRSVRVQLGGGPDAAGWSRLRVRGAGRGEDFSGHFRRSGTEVFTWVRAVLPGRSR